MNNIVITHDAICVQLYITGGVARVGRQWHFTDNAQANEQTKKTRGAKWGNSYPS